MPVCKISVIVTDQGNGGWFSQCGAHGYEDIPDYCPGCGRMTDWDGTFGGDFGGSDF